MMIEFLSNETFRTAFRVAAVLAAFVTCWRLIPLFLERVLPETVTDHSKSLIIKSTSYSLVVIVIFIILDQMGFNLGAVLGTAGIFGVAIGFASQSSLSNIICGLFLLSEKPFAVGEVISIGGITGVVHSFDLISVKVRTFDNKLVRLPNESIFKKEVTNITRFPIRRLNINIEVSLKEDTRKVQEIIQASIDANPFALEQPTPILFLDKISHASQEFFVGVWIMGDQYLDLKKTLLLEIKENLQANGVELPFSKYLSTDIPKA